jgi:hypothetical protein
MWRSTADANLIEMPVDERTWTLASGGEWSEVVIGALPKSRNSLVEVSMCGAAEAAGISFGSYKDFLAPVARHMGERRLQVEIDADARRWTFRADGVLMGREWWDGAVRTVDDLIDTTLTLKSHNTDEVVFRDLTIRSFESSCRVSVVMTCCRFAQRLRVALASWCRQRVPSGTIEIIVVNPESPDGTHQVMASMAAAYPEVRLREFCVAGTRARNKGWMLNRGSEASVGEWVWFTDADCVFPDDAVARLLAAQFTPSSLGYGERRHLAKVTTDVVLAGRIDPTLEFDRLADQSRGVADIYPWGFTQILHRSQLERIRYREDVDNFAGSDGAFIEDCRKAGLHEVRLDGLRCLHLAHPFAWYGTNHFL